MSLPLTDDDGVVLVSPDGVPVSWNAGLGYDADGKLCITQATELTDVYQGGRRMSARGKLVTADSTPAGRPFNHNAGWPFDKNTGATIYQSGTPDPTDPRVAGVAVGPLGGVYMRGTAQVSAPTFSPDAGVYFEPVSVTLASVTPGASIRYTTDGSVPTSTTGTLYTGPISLTAETLLRAIAYNGVLADSSVRTRYYQFQALTPTFTPGTGQYPTAQSVTIATDTPGTTIKYTTDGSNPSEFNGTVYTAPVNIAVTTALRAAAYKTGWLLSSIGVANYNIGQVTTYELADDNNVQLLLEDTGVNALVTDNSPLTGFASGFYTVSFGA